jgi:hypothetical protein
MENTKNIQQNLIEKKDIKNNLIIFDKYINDNYHLIPFNVRKMYLGSIKYYPPVSKEWKNTIYAFNNNNNTKNLPVYDNNIYYLINSYFNSWFYFKNINNRFIPRRIKRQSLNRIFLSKAEIKHTNSKAIITIYTYNREKLSILKKIYSLKKLSYLNVFRNVKILINKIMKYFINKKINLLSSDIFFLTRKIIKNLLNKHLILFRKYKLKYNLNKYKFEEKLLYILSSIISKYYNKKVEFNIVNMKSIILNSDIFTKILTLKLRKTKSQQIMSMMKFILNKANLPSVNRILEKGSRIKSVDFNLLENKFFNININSMLKKNSLDKLLNELYHNEILHKNNNLDRNYYKINEIIFNSIKYKNMGGIRLIVSGRLTKRYRADRALYKVRWKGGLKNIDSSYKGLSSVNMRGYMNPNVEYSIFTSKRRVGSFAVKGWISGK